MAGWDLVLLRERGVIQGAGQRKSVSSPTWATLLFDVAVGEGAAASTSSCFNGLSIPVCASLTASCCQGATRQLAAQTDFQSSSSLNN